MHMVRKCKYTRHVEIIIIFKYINTSYDNQHIVICCKKEPDNQLLWTMSEAKTSVPEPKRYYSQDGMEYCNACETFKSVLFGQDEDGNRMCGHCVRTFHECSKCKLRSQGFELCIDCHNIRATKIQERNKAKGKSSLDDDENELVAVFKTIKTRTKRSTKQDAKGVDPAEETKKAAKTQGKRKRISVKDTSDDEDEDDGEKTKKTKKTKKNKKNKPDERQAKPKGTKKKRTKTARYNWKKWKAVGDLAESDRTECIGLVHCMYDSLTSREDRVVGHDDNQGVTFSHTKMRLSIKISENVTMVIEPKINVEN